MKLLINDWLEKRKSVAAGRALSLHVEKSGSRNNGAPNLETVSIYYCVVNKKLLV